MVFANLQGVYIGDLEMEKEAQRFLSVIRRRTLRH